MDKLKLVLNVLPLSPHKRKLLQSALSPCSCRWF